MDDFRNDDLAEVAHGLAIDNARLDSEERAARQTVAFTVDASSVLQQCEVDLQRDEHAIGLRFGLREIRRHLHAIGRRALILRDRTLIDILANLCVLRPSSADDLAETSEEEVRAVVSVACPVCDGLTPVEEMNVALRTVACNHCARPFDVPDSAIRDAQNQCLVALGEA